MLAAHTIHSVVQTVVNSAGAGRHSIAEEHIILELTERQTIVNPRSCALTLQYLRERVSASRSTTTEKGRPT